MAFLLLNNQIEAAFTHLVKYNKSIDRDVRFAVTCGNAGGLKGIHLRGQEATKPVEIPVKVIEKKIATPHGILLNFPVFPIKLN